MSAADETKSSWGVETVEPPKLTDTQWNLTGLLGIILILMAILQLVSFGSFKDWLGQVGLSGPTVWAILIIIAELWGAAAYFKVRLSPLFRAVSSLLAMLAAGFWFVENLQLIAGGAAGQLDSSGFFGHYLNQSPGWWTALEVTVLLFWTIYSVGLTSLDTSGLRAKLAGRK